MFIRIGDIILNTNHVVRVKRANGQTYVYMAAEHDAYNGGGNHTISEAFGGPEGEALWEWFCGEVDAADVVGAAKHG